MGEKGKGRKGEENMHTSNKKRAFTLIELLIVVAIIAILAAIAVPNFLEAQVRSKVARVKADIRSAATALEAYRVDYQDYPLEGILYLEYVYQLTTPVAYITSVALKDPFQPQSGIPSRFFWTNPPAGWIGSFNFFRYNQGWAMGCYGGTYLQPGYGVLSHGPSKEWSWIEHYPYFKATGGSHTSAGITRSGAENTVYDPSNGTKSFGGIARFGGLPGIPDTP